MAVPGDMCDPAQNDKQGFFFHWSNGKSTQRKTWPITYPESMEKFYLSVWIPEAPSYSLDHQSLES